MTPPVYFLDRRYQLPRRRLSLPLLDEIATIFHFEHERASAVYIGLDFLAAMRCAAASSKRHFIFMRGSGII